VIQCSQRIDHLTHNQSRKDVFNTRKKTKTNESQVKDDASSPDVNDDSMDEGFDLPSIGKFDSNWNDYKQEKEVTESPNDETLLIKN
jgi:hypothetical protein